MKHTKKYRRRLIAIITLILLILLSLWMFIKASEDEEAKQEYYKPYRGNVLGVAGDFCVFTKGDAGFSEVTADIAVGGDFTKGNFGNYETRWDFYKNNDLRFVNLNSYIRGKYEGEKYCWQANRTKAELTCQDGTTIKGTYDCGNANGKANLYIYTGEKSENTVDSEHSNNQCMINGKCLENQYKTDENGKCYQAYNVVEVKCEFIDFEEEFNKLDGISDELIHGCNALDVDCDTKDVGGKIFTYTFPKDEKCMVINVNAEDFFDSKKCDTFNIANFDSTKKIVINVDCTNSFGSECPITPKTYVNGDPADWNPLAENILWNFYCPKGTKNAQLEANEIIGTVFAPNIDVNINGNLDGAIISQKATSNNAIYGMNCGITWNDINKKEITQVYVEKEWIDGEEKDKRPEKVQFKLLADGEEKGTIDLTKEGKIVRIKDIEQKDENGEEKTAKSISYSSNGNKVKATAPEEECTEYYLEFDITDVQDEWWKYQSQNINITITDNNGTKTTKTLNAASLSYWGYNAEANKIKIPKGGSVTITFDSTCINSNNGDASECYIASITTKINDCGVNIGWPRDCNWIIVKLSKSDCGCSSSITVDDNGKVENGTDPTDPTDPGEGGTGGETNPGGETDPGGGESGGSGSEIDPSNPSGGEQGGGTGGETTDPEDPKEPEEEEPKEEEKLKDWSCTIKDLPKYRENDEETDEDGEGEEKEKKEIVYTIEEVDAGDNYISEIEEIKDDENEEDKGKYAAKYKIINTLLTDIEGEKIWEDSNDNDGVRPESIEVTLYQKVDDGEDQIVEEYKAKIEEGQQAEEEQTEEGQNDNEGTEQEEQEGQEEQKEKSKFKNPITVTKDSDSSEEEKDSNKWKFKFEGVKKYDKDGNEIEYTVKEKITDEKAKDKYQEKIDGMKITNKHKLETTEVTVTKVWDDKDNQDGYRPEEVKVTLLADGEEIKVDDKTNESEDEKEKVETTVTLNKANNWTYTFKNLQKYKNKEEIKYTVKEVIEDEKAKDKYEVTYENDDTGLKVINKHEPEKLSITVKKIWDDNDDQDGKRPESVTVKILENENELKDKKVTLNEDNNWEATIDDLPKFKDGKEIVYTVDEEKIEDYKKDVKKVEKKEDSEKAEDGKEVIVFEITNTHEPEKTKVSGKKSWDDKDNQDGIRPEKVKVKLLADGEPVADKEVEVSETTEWKYEFTDVPKYKNKGKEIVYTVEEEAVEGYTAEVDSDNNITNKHKPETIDIEGTKTWDDSDNQDGKRPKEITIRLFANDKEKEKKVVKPDEDNNWKYKFTNLPKYEKGQVIKYTIKEDEVKDYDTTIDEYNITNKHTPETITVKGKKTWEDANNQDGIRPESITIKLLADGEEVKDKTVTASAETDWEYEFKDVPKYRDQGVEIKYTVKEDEIEGYTAKVDKNNNITNTHIPETIDIKGTKKWDDADNQDGKRPNKITIKVFANGKELTDKKITVIADDKWEYEIKDLPKNEAGKPIKYTVEEEAITGYSINVEGYDITNSHEPEKIDISGTKTWDDADNQDGKRPDSITVKLVANKEVKETKTVTAENNWSYEFKGVDKYANGKEIKYSIEEDEVNDYTLSTDGYNLKNTHKPETIVVEGTKKWDDADDQDGKRPKQVTVKLSADGKEIKTETVTAESKWKYKFENLPKYKEGKIIEYTIDEADVKDYTKEIKGYDIINHHEPEKTSISGTKTWDDNDDQDGVRPDSIRVKLFGDGEEVETRKVTKENDWKYEFKDLPKYKKGVEIKYTIDEVDVKDYTKEVKGYDVTNTHTPEKTEVSGTKIWEDEDNQDGIRPEKIKVILLADGQEKETQEVTAKDEWTYTFKDLDKYSKGKEIKYTIKEEEVKGYTSKVDKDNNITNTHKPEVTSISGEKKWVDEKNQDGIRPKSIEVKLLDGENVVATKTVTADTDWKYTFENVPKFRQGKEIQYTVDEEDVPGYDKEIKGYNITNTHKIEKVSVSGTKTWVDDNDQDKVRPESITVNLYANGEKVDSQKVTKADEWKYTFKDLAKYADGQEINYTINEDKVDGYEKSINGYDITNTHESKKISVSGTKIWVDPGYESFRPESVKINLLADNKTIQSKEVTADDEWKYEFTDLPKYEAGKEIVYTITEDEVEGYETTINDYNVINRYYAVAGEEVIDIDVEKEWEDEGYEAIRPSSVKVNLLANGKVVRTQEITAKNKWKFTFKQVELYDKNGDIIKYTVTEDAISGYETRVDGFKITNTYVPKAVEDKIMIKLNKYEKGTTKKLKDAKFELVIKKEDGKDKDNKKKYKEVLKKTNTTNSIGQIILKDLDLETGTYVLEITEKEAPKGYKKANDSIKVEFTVKEQDGKKVIKLKEKYKNAEVEKTVLTVKVENTKEQHKDNTTSKGKLPQTGPGKTIVVGAVVIGFLVVGAIGIFKYREVKF